MADSNQKTQKKYWHKWLLRRQIGREYLEGNKTQRELSKAYGVPVQSISRWSRAYAAEISELKGRILERHMTPEEQKQYEVLKQQNEALKEELEFAQMKARAMEIMIELAKQEYGIDVTKNSGARQPAKSKKTTRRQK